MWLSKIDTGPKPRLRSRTFISIMSVVVLLVEGRLVARIDIQTAKPVPNVPILVQVEKKHLSGFMRTALITLVRYELVSLSLFAC